LDSDPYKQKRIRIREALCLPPRDNNRAKINVNMISHCTVFWLLLFISLKRWTPLAYLIFKRIFPLKFVLFFLKAKNKGGLTTPQKLLRQKFSKPEGENLSHEAEESPHHTSAGEEEGETVTNTTSQKSSQLDKSAERKGPIKAMLQVMFHLNKSSTL
jgi:hypothetical protein